MGSSLQDQVALVSLSPPYQRALGQPQAIVGGFKIAVLPFKIHKPFQGLHGLVDDRQELPTIKLGKRSHDRQVGIPRTLPDLARFTQRFFTLPTRLKDALALLVFARAFCTWQRSRTPMLPGTGRAARVGSARAGLLD